MPPLLHNHLAAAAPVPSLAEKVWMQRAREHGYAPKRDSPRAKVLAQLFECLVQRSSGGRAVDKPFRNVGDSINQRVLLMPSKKCGLIQALCHVRHYKGAGYVLGL
jgi:hypothetical protein